MVNIFPGKESAQRYFCALIEHIRLIFIHLKPGDLAVHQLIVRHRLYKVIIHENIKEY